MKKYGLVFLISFFALSAMEPPKGFTPSNGRKRKREEPKKTEEKKASLEIQPPLKKSKLEEHIQSLPLELQQEILLQNIKNEFNQNWQLWSQERLKKYVPLVLNTYIPLFPLRIKQRILHQLAKKLYLDLGRKLSIPDQ